jgi:hypothetical protein
MYKNFDWPIPPSYELPAGAEFSGHEPCLLTLRRGQKLNGLLTRFLLVNGVVEFLPSRGRINIDIPLEDILQLRLTRPLKLKRRRTAIEQRSGEVLPPSEKQPFVIELCNDETLAGESVGFELQACGLFLYVPTYGESVLRTFVPASAMRRHQIGKPIGEILAGTSCCRRCTRTAPRRPSCGFSRWAWTRSTSPIRSPACSRSRKRSCAAGMSRALEKCSSTNAPAARHASARCTGDEPGCMNCW